MERGLACAGSLGSALPRRLHGTTQQFSVGLAGLQLWLLFPIWLLKESFMRYRLVIVGFA